MKKLTLVLVALLLALACVFAACGKKNDTPTDTNPKPVDDNPAVVNPTVAKEDLVKIAEDLKVAAAANYVDLYSAEVANAIETEKSNVLAQIYAASTKEEAQKIADNFIIFLKAQKTTVDELKDLIEKIGEVSLADEDAIKQAFAYKTALENAYAVNNDAKKAALDAFKADKTTKETIQKMKDRLDVLLKVKEDADDKDNDGINNGVDKDENVETIAELKALFTGEKYEFSMKSYDIYQAIVAAVETIAKDNDIKTDSEAYAEIFDVATLAEMKALLDAAIAAKPVLSDLKAIIDAAEALKTAAEEARYKEFCYINEKDPGKTEYDTEEKALAAVKDSTKEDVKYVEAGSTDPDGEGKDKGLYKLSLKADIEAAEDLVTKLNKKYTKTELENAGLKAGSEGKKALADIEATRTAYNASITEAGKRLKDYLVVKTNYVSAKPEKDPTIATFTGFTTAAKNYKVATTGNGTKLGDEITEVVDSFKTVNDSGYKVSYKKGYINQGDYTLSDKADADRSFYLIDGAAAIKYTAWTYSYEFDGKALGAVEVFDVLAEKANYDDAKAALKWFTIFLGEGEYEEKYELTKDYGFAKIDENDVVLYTTDRDVKEVAKAGVVEINGKAVDVAADAATEIKMLSSYTVAKAVVKACEEITAAQEAAKEELKAAVLALRETGDANAIVDARALYNAIKNGSYVNKKLNGEAADEKNNDYYAVKEADLKAIKVVIKEATADKDAVEADLWKMLDAAEAAYNEAIKLVSLSDFDAEKAGLAKNLKDAKEAFATNEKLVAAFAKIVEKAAAEVARCQAAYDLTTTDTARIKNQKALDDAKAAKAKVDALADLIVAKAAFDAVNYNEETKEYSILEKVDTAKAADIWALIKDYTDFKTVDYGDLNEAAGDDAAAKQALYDLCKDILAVYTTNKDQVALKAAVDEAEKKLVKAYADFKLDYTVKAKVATADFFSALKDFADEDKFNADYLNLTVSYTYGDNTVTVDLFTEAYRQAALAKVFDKIAKIQAAAKKEAGSDVLASEEAGSWKALVKANVEETEVKFDAQTSIKEAKELVEAYDLSDATYKLDTALDAVNAARKVADKTEITLERLKQAIADEK